MFPAEKRQTSQSSFGVKSAGNAFSTPPPKMTKNRLLKWVFNLQTYMADAPTFRMLKLMAVKFQACKCKGGCERCYFGCFHCVLDQYRRCPPGARWHPTWDRNTNFVWSDFSELQREAGGIPRNREGRTMGRIKLHQCEALYVIITTCSELVGANHSGMRTQKSLLQKLEF